MKKVSTEEWAKMSQKQKEEHLASLEEPKKKAEEIAENNFANYIGDFRFDRENQSKLKSIFDLVFEETAFKDRFGDLEEEEDVHDIIYTLSTMLFDHSYNRGDKYLWLFLSQFKLYFPQDLYIYLIENYLSGNHDT